ncbi:hypothetical protein DW228_18565 [Bacteroides fragilis]|uniref:Pentapeptide repeat-containing protein n=1 Tax=Bacteroides fragilis TaxID=817 RepID=A0A396BUM5_BACFG|nr:pentapeptide repeat-containing protein [Bacteroides fragilis]RHH07937.1 hypothetical protein DW228_18565 [Bacteroides fragilis]
MCNYEYVEVDARKEQEKFPCCLDYYFSLLGEATGAKYELPVDDKGFCIFHSEDLKWKNEHNFNYWFSLLFDFLSLVDDSTIEYEHNGWKEFDFRGVKWIGTANRGAEPFLLLDKLNFSSSMFFLFQKGIFYCELLMDNCNFLECDIDLSLCTFLKPVSLTHLKVNRISCDNSSFLNGLDMGNCVIFKDASFYSMKVSGEFCFASVEFGDVVNFSFSKFDTTLWTLNNISFEMDTDFSSCIFNGRLEFENCTFLAGASFKNALFNDLAEFIESEYYEDVIFESEKSENKIFNKSIRLNLNDDNTFGCFHFKNVNFFNIAEKDRKFLLDHQKDDKAYIGSGCIKYKVQSPIVNIKTDLINQYIIEELTYSFKNYFFHSSGFSLGVEFQDKCIDKISLFYFTDEDIEQSEFLERLGFWGSRYWAFPLDSSEFQFEKTGSAVQKLDDFISKYAVVRKIAVRDLCGYWHKEDTKLLFEVIPCLENKFKLLEDFLRSIETNKMNITMQIDNLNVHGGQVNILENVTNASIQQTVNALPDELIKCLELLMEKLSKEEAIELEGSVRILNNGPAEGEMESLKKRVLNFMNRHGIAVAQSMTASAIFEGLRVVLGIG